MAQAERGERQIIFPTLCNLETLCGFESAEQALEASRERSVVTVLPKLLERDGERRLVIPSDAGYALSEQKLQR